MSPLRIIALVALLELPMDAASVLAASDADLPYPQPIFAALAVTNESGQSFSLFSREGYRCEFRYLRRICHAVNLSGPARRMTGLQKDVLVAQWPFMQFCYFGYACVTLAECDPQFRVEALEEARWLIEALQTPRLSGFITDHFGPPFGENFSTPSVFVHGLFLNLAIRYRAVSGDTRYDVLIHRIAKALSSEFERNDQGILPTYPGMWWITDNLPALSALTRYDNLFRSNLSNVKERFLQSVRSHYLDNKGMFGSYIDPIKRATLQGVRGVGISYALHFLKDLDPDFARHQYTLAKSQLFRSTLGFGAVREFPEGVKEDIDVDSGDVVLGLGMAASGFGIAAAAVMGDEEMTIALLKSSAVLGMPVLRNGELRYDAMPPVGQAVILFGKAELVKLQQAKLR